MSKKVGTWWIKDGLDDRRKEAQGFGEMLNHLSSFYWTDDHGEEDVLRKDFVETQNYIERVDNVSMMYMSSHGSYDPDNSSTWGKAFCTSDGTVTTSDSIEWGKSDLEYFSSHACKLLYHSSSNSVARWVSAFRKLHYMFGFHTVSHSGKGQKDRGSKFALYAAWHLFFPAGILFMPSSYTLRAAWKKTCILTEGDDVKWAYLRANGRPIANGPWVDTYNERLEVAEPADPVVDREFFSASGSC